MTTTRPTPMMLAVLTEMQRTGGRIVWDYRDMRHNTYRLNGRRLFAPTASGLSWRGLITAVLPVSNRVWEYEITEAGQAALTSTATPTPSTPTTGEQGR